MSTKTTTAVARPALSYRDRTFILEFLANGGNAMAAYRQSFPRASQPTVHAEAHRYLAKPRIRSAIDKASVLDP
jgi:hypothetical protein